MDDDHDGRYNRPNTLERRMAVRIVQARLSAKLDALDVAESLHLSVDQYLQVEAAQFRLSAENLVHFARLTGHPVAWFFSNSEST